MPIIRQRVAGRLLVDGQRNVVVLDEAAAPLYLAYAFIRRGVESHLLPESLLDDWGTEFASLRLYRWVREYGDRFPRAEIFGYEPGGAATQAFLRELELGMKYPCYAFETTGAPVAAGVLVGDVVVGDGAVAALTAVARPVELKRPLRTAAVRWWAAPPGLLGALAAGDLPPVGA